MLKYSPFCIPHFHSVFLKPKSIIDSITCEIKISGIKLQAFLTQYQLLITNSFFEHWFMNNRGRTMVTSSFKYFKFKYLSHFRDSLLFPWLVVSGIVINVSLHVSPTHTCITYHNSLHTIRSLHNSYKIFNPGEWASLRLWKIKSCYITTWKVHKNSQT